MKGVAPPGAATGPNKQAGGNIELEIELDAYGMPVHHTTANSDEADAEDGAQEADAAPCAEVRLDPAGLKAFFVPVRTTLCRDIVPMRVFLSR